MKKIYLAIPYTTMEQSSFEQASELTAKLINLGFNVFSPITHSHPLTKFNVKGDWDFWEKIDKTFIDWCNEVWVIIPKEGYNKVLNSIGINAEIDYALNKNKLVKTGSANELIKNRNK